MKNLTFFFIFLMFVLCISCKDDEKHDKQSNRIGLSTNLVEFGKNGATKTVTTKNDQWWFAQVTTVDSTFDPVADTTVIECDWFKIIKENKNIHITVKENISEENREALITLQLVNYFAYLTILQD